MEHVLEFCCGVNKNYFQDAIMNKTQIIKFERGKSAEVVRKFREEFCVSKDIYSDIAIEKKLEENNFDIHRTFQDFFG